MKIVSLLLVSLLVWEGVSFARQPTLPIESSQVQAQETPQAAKIKAKVQKRGTGEKSRVKVKLVNGTEVKGYISRIEESSFALTNTKTGQTTTIPFTDVQKIRGPGLSTGSKVAIGIAVGVVVFFAIFGGLAAAGAFSG